MFSEGEFVMPTKTIEKEQIVQGKLLRSISQKDLKEMVDTTDKVGVMLGSDLSLVMINWDRYSQMVDLITEKEDEISKLSNMIEDLQLSLMYGKEVEKIERGEVKSYEIHSARDHLKHLNLKE